jgi:hypothetical protein
MTYRELLGALCQLSDEQLGMDVCVYDSEMSEAFDVSEMNIAEKFGIEDVVGENQPILAFNINT